MEKADYFSVTYDYLLTLSTGPFSPEYADSVVDNPSRITGIIFTYKIGEGTVNEEMEQDLLNMGINSDVSRAAATSGGQFKEEFYFIGRIANYDEIKEFLGEPEERFERYAVSHDESGNIIDIRPIYSNEEVIPVKDQEELKSIYFQKTGKNFPAAGIRM